MKKRILIIGASSSLAEEVIPQIVRQESLLGLHYSQNRDAVQAYENYNNVYLIQKDIGDENDCKKIVDLYLKWAGGIDCLVILIGNISSVKHWEELNVDDMQGAYLLNTVYPLMFAKYAYPYMNGKCARIIFISTSSAKRGGGSMTLGYGMAKYALECATMRLAKDLAKRKITVNAIAPGFFDTKIHTKKAEDIKSRIDFIPLKRAGTKEEFASLLLYLLSEQAGFITGQVIPIDGGDFV